MATFLADTLVLIPALNEAESIATTIDRWKRLGVAAVRVVDNGSSDSTAAVAEAHGAEVLSEPRRGYGAAAARGSQNLPSGIGWILFSSADGSDRLDAAQIPDWQRLVDNGADLIIGDRVTPAASRQQLKMVQSFGNRLCCHLIALGWGQRFKDMGSLRLVRRTALEAMDLQDRSFGWNIEMQVRAIEHGFSVVEIPVNHHPRLAGESKISGNLLGTLRAGASILNMTFQLWRTRRSERFQPHRSKPC